MANLLQTFCSEFSLESSSYNERKQVLEHVSDQDIHESIRKINVRNRNIAEDLVQASRFMITISKEDLFLTIYSKKGLISSVKVTKGEGRRILSIKMKNRRNFEVSSKFHKIF